MKKAFVFVGTCLVTLLGLLTACTQSAGTSQEGGYKTMTVKKENRLLTNSYSAVVKGRQSVEIRPQVSTCERSAASTWTKIIMGITTRFIFFFR